MKGLHKKFEQDVYDKCDGLAKEAMRIHLELMGHTVTVPPENFGPDLYSVIFFRKMYHEVEVSLKWETGKHPYPTGSIPERKHRLIAGCDACQLFFWMLRSDLARALVFPASCLLEQYLVEVPNYKIAVGEYFYRIPKELGKEFNLYAIDTDGQNSTTV